jgi:RNA polymerase sigma-70 factor (ECF subfamily)
LARLLLILARVSIPALNDARQFAATCWLGLASSVRELLDVADTRARLLSALPQARVSWPTLTVAPARFAEYVAERISDAAGLEALLAPATLSELYLCCACADGDEDAIVALEANYFPSLVVALARLRLESHAVDEVLQRLRSQLFLQRSDGKRGIAGFRGGRGTLAGWLSVIAVREGYRLVKRERRDAGSGDAELARLSGSERDLEKQYAARWSRDVFQRAFTLALAQLDNREKSLLRMHYLDGMTLEQLATVYRTHRATAVRWLAAARQRLLDRTRATLVEQLRVPIADCESIIRSAREQLELTLHRLFASEITASA